MAFDVPRLADLDVENQRVLVRVDFNVPRAEDGTITDDTRIRAAVPTIQNLLERGARPVLLSHLGRPKGTVVEELRLDAVGVRLGELLETPVRKLDESVGDAVRAAIDSMGAGEVCLLENVRFHPGETKGDPELAAAFAALGDRFVNDAFGACHRAHASVAGVARLLPAAAGFLLEKELDAFGRVLTDPDRPLVAILGGAKISDKLPVIANLVERCDAILIGGGMAYTLLAARGEPTGTSLLQADQVEAVRANLERAKETGCRILVPTDHVVADSFAADAKTQVVEVIPDGWMGLDIGPETRKTYAAEIAAARTVVWNGPMGVFEWEAFQAGTEEVGRAVEASPAYTVVGGGDSVAAVSLFDLADGMDHISTGGGASLELLEGKDLPGIEALGSR
ncbi:MAG TPA: phosphoglycerate kinase [Planctomycetes bacterium]|nr:phosphoglycerate kinase [Planctomycetota bacterium]